MKLIRCIVVPQPVVPADRTKNYRLGWGRHLVWVFAIAASVCLMGSAAKADELSEILEIEEDLADCRNSCHIKGLQDYLACGRTAEACLKRLIYLPWWVSQYLRTQCQGAQSQCQNSATLDGAKCVESCDSDAVRRRQKMNMERRRIKFLKDHA